MKGRAPAANVINCCCWMIILTRIGGAATLAPFSGESSMPYLGEVDEEAEWSPEDSTTTSTTSSVYEEVSTLLPTMRPAQDDVPDIPLEFSDILPANRRSYDKMEPPKKDGKPTTVFFHVTVMSLDSIDESSMTYAADIFFSQTWQDYRLRFPDNLTADYRLLPTSWLHSMWRPDSFFKNAKKVTFQDVTIPNHYIWLYKDKSILYMVKLTLILSCSMNFHLYPHDTQQCAMKIESLSHTTDDLVFIWQSVDPLVVDDRIELPQLDLVSNVTGDCTQVYSTGNFTCLEVILSFRRRLGYYLFHTYIPTCLIVVMSWISFWIRPEAVPARVTLGVTSLLTLHTQHANSQKALPPVSYIKAIDVFMSGCTVFVFLSLMEYALVNILMGDVVDGEESAVKKGMKSLFVTSSGGNGGGGGTSQQQQQQQQQQGQQLDKPGTSMLNNSRCCLGHNSQQLPRQQGPPTTAGGMTRSQSMMTSHRQPTCPHISAEIHLHAEASGSAVPTRQQRQHLQPMRGTGGAQTDAERSGRAGDECGLSSRLLRMNEIVLTGPSSSVMVEEDDCPAPPPPTPILAESNVPVQRKRNNGCPRQQPPPPGMIALENGRLPLISSLHSAGQQSSKPGDSSGPSTASPHQPRFSYGTASSSPKASLNLQQLKRAKAIAVDRMSRIMFPLSFFILNVAYWAVFLNTQGNDVKISPP